MVVVCVVWLLMPDISALVVLCSPRELRGSPDSVRQTWHTIHRGFINVRPNVICLLRGTWATAVWHALL